MNYAFTNNCSVCLGRHDDEIHDATLRIHLWLRQEILRQIEPWTMNPGRPPEVPKK